jgi:subtilisin family serine protease
VDADMLEVPPRIYGEALPRAERASALFSCSEPITSANVHELDCEDGAIREAAELLGREGFEVVHAGRLSISITGPADLYERVLGTSLKRGVQEVAVAPGCRRKVPLVEVAGADDPSFIDASRSRLARAVRGVVITSPCHLSASGPPNLPVSPMPPPVPYDSVIEVPAALSLALAAERLHSDGCRGAGVHVVAVDSGCFAHPFFERVGAQIEVVCGPGTSDPRLDELGHGTLVVGNLVSLAPDARVTVIKATEQTSVVAFKIAVEHRPAIIQSTWGKDLPHGPEGAEERLIAALVADAVRKGIIVVFACGNGGKLFPAQIPEVLAIGGVYIRVDGTMEASDYASGYESAVFPGRIVPDLCGLVGMQPMGVYIMLPTQPASVIDQSFAERPYPQGDDTSPDDGWVCLSGTSSASAQVSGICALLCQLDPSLTTARAKELLTGTARHVGIGVSSQGNPAGPGQPNLATGFGLADASRAALAMSKRPPGRSES